MAMRSSSRTELNKLRELVHFLLNGAGGSLRDGQHRIQCCFCTKLLGDYADDVEHGNSVGPKLTVRITIHHKDGNHDNNEESNKAACHTKCHKSYHRKVANTQRAVSRNEAFE